MAEELGATPPHLRQGHVSLQTVGPGWFAVAVWVELSSGRRFVIKEDRRGPLNGAARLHYVRDAIGWRAKEVVA